MVLLSIIKEKKHYFMDDGLPCIIILICVIFSAFFSATETAYTSSNRIKLKTQADDGDKKAEQTLLTLEKYDRLISTILIGNNIVNIAASSIATVLFTNWFSNNGSWISTIVMTIIILIFGEVIPKNFGKNHAESVAKFVNPFVKFLIYLFLPLSFVLGQISKLFNRLFKSKDQDGLNEDDLLTIIDEIEEEGKIKPYEKDLISSAIKFDDIDVKDIVTPRKDIIGIDLTMTIEEIRKTFEDSKFTRIPVYEGTIDNIIGILHEKDFYSYLIKNGEETFKLKKVMQPVNFVSQETKISIVFKMFKDKRVHMAVVLDQFDSTLGLITMEDIIEELVGEIFDETDEIFEETKKIDDDHYVASGKEIVHDAFDIIGIQIDDEEDFDLNQTINSWLCKEFGRIPMSGDNFIFMDEWKVSVKSATRKGAKEVEFSKQ